MADQSIATVFGGSGFIGRQIVRRLAAQGYHVRIAVRAPDAADRLKLLGDVGQITVLRAAVTDAAAVARAVAGAAVVVNLVGILAEQRPGEFMRVQAAVLERLPGNLLTRDQLRLLQMDNVVTPGHPGLAELGIVAKPVALVVPGYLARFRPGGR